MEAKSPQKRSFAELDEAVWIASAKYMRGEISMEELDEVERPYNQAFEEAVLAIARRQYAQECRRQLARLKPVALTLFLVAVSITIILLTKNGLALIIPFIPLFIRWLK